jgi:hypothetical protein
MESKSVAVSQPAASSQIDLSLVEPLITELESLLADDDTRSAKEFDKLAAMLTNSDFSIIIKEMRSMLGRYEFEECLEKMAELKEILKKK